MNWFYAKNGAQQGPLSTDELKSRIAMGEVGPKDLAWSEGMPDWMPISEISQLKIEAPVREAEVPPPVLSAGPSPYQSPSAPAPAGYQAPLQGVPGQSPAQGLAIGALVCGIIAFIGCCTGVFGGLVALAAIILGHIAISRVNANPGAFGGKGMARTGLIFGYLGLIGAIIFTVIGIWASGLSPEELEEKVIQLFPEQYQEEMRNRFEEQRSNRLQP